MTPRRSVTPMLLTAAMSVVGACTPSRAPTSEQAAPATVPPASPATRAQAAVTEASAVREAFEAYRAAILNNDADAALGLVTAETIAHYEQLRQLALTGTRESILKLPATDALTALILRLRVPVAELEGMNGEGILRHAFANGWVGKNSVLGLEVVEVEVVGETAFVKARNAEGVELPFVFELELQQQAWRVNLMRLMRDTSGALAQLLDQLDPARDKALIALIGKTGLGVDETVWEPLAPGARK